MDQEQQPRGRLRRSIAEKDKLIAAFEAAGQTQRQFCLEHDLSAVTFSAWLRQRRAGGAPVGFREVRFAGGRCAGITVRLPEGIEIEFAGGVETGAVASLVAALRGSAV